jgi:tripartite-type tricarboxylate transporter receptor subunit TctC
MTKLSPTAAFRKTGILSRITGLVSCAVALAAAGINPATAQGAYPNKPIKLIAPYAAGGAADTVARIVGQKLSESMGQPVIIENRTGASGAIGAGFVVTSPPDGYTLLMNLGPPHTTLQFFTKGAKYDPVKDFTPIALAATAPQALVVASASPIKTIAEYIAAAKSQPNGLSYGTSGNGTSQHLAGLLLGDSQKIKLTHVPYKGGAAALTDVVGGQLDSGILVLSNTLPYIQSGKLRVLGVVENHRSKSAPNIPTLAEGGLSGFAVPDTWVGVLGPAGMPAPIVQRLHAEISKALKNPEVKSKLETAGYEVVEATPQEFTRLMTDSIQVFKGIVTKAGIQPE